MNAMMKRLATFLVLILCLNSVTFALASGDIEDQSTAQEAGNAVSEQQTALEGEGDQPEEAVQSGETLQSGEAQQSGENQQAVEGDDETIEGDVDAAVSDEEQDGQTVLNDGDEEEIASDIDDEAQGQIGDGDEGEPSVPEIDTMLPLPQEPVIESVPFSARIRAMLKNDGAIYFGDKVSLVAVVMGATDEYDIRWDYYKEDADVEHGENPWVPCGDGELYSFIADKDNTGVTYRTVVVSGDVEIISREVTVPKATNRPQSDNDAADADRPQTLPMPEGMGPMFQITDEGIIPVVPQEDGEEEENGEPDADVPQTQPEDEDPADAEEPADEEPTPEKPAEPYYYEYERDEDGNLILNNEGNPIPIVPEGVDIPVEWLRDEDGNLVLDENGNPIATQFIPATAQRIDRLEDLLDPNRSIDIYADWGGGELYFGDESTLIAVLHGYDNAVYTLRWQESKEGIEWQDIEGATDARYTMIVTEENYLAYWRVVVTITDVQADGEPADVVED